MGPNMKNRITRSNIIFFDQIQITSSRLGLKENEEDKGNLVHKQEYNIAVLIGSIAPLNSVTDVFANTPIISGCICEISFKGYQIYCRLLFHYSMRKTSNIQNLRSINDCTICDNCR